jgi:hypothetical protein
VIRVLVCVLVASVLVSAQPTVDPSTLPLVQEADLQYLGATRAPQVDASAYGGVAIAFDQAKRSLWMGFEGGKVAEFSVPAPVIGPAGKLPIATMLQGFADPTEGHLHDRYKGDVRIYGLLVHGNDLIGGASIYYDANHVQDFTSFRRSLDLKQPSWSGWSRVGGARQSGWIGGWMAPVPAEWQSLLGGPAITGQCCIPIVSRTSYGPAAWAFDPAKVGDATVPAQPLVYYPETNRTLGPWEGQNINYGMGTRMGGVAIIHGTRSALFVGTNGLGPACYGDGTADKAAADRSQTDELCYDPTDSNKGTHAYPYRYQVWAYDLNDFAAVKAGKKQPWDVKPYAVWELKLPLPAPQMLIGGVAYDAQTKTLLVSQLHADKSDFRAFPVVNHFRIAVGSVPPPPVVVPPVVVPPVVVPPVVVPPPPPPVPQPITVSCTVQSVSAYADRDAKLTVRCNTNGKVSISKGTAFTIVK